MKELSMLIHLYSSVIQDGVTSPEDIETGVKLGMNRPFGPISVASGLTNSEIKEKLVIPKQVYCILQFIENARI